MTANELLIMVGRAWSRLLLYPGGLAAFGIVWLLSLFQSWKTRAPQLQVEETIDNRRWTMGRRLLSIVYRQKPEWLGDATYLAVRAIVPPWLALALLPLPLALALPRQIDMIVALALLECPNLMAIRYDTRAGDIRRLAAALNSYPPLLLAALALAQAGNSLELAALARVPGDLVPTGAAALHWLGAVALTLALPPALGIGPFAGGGRRGKDGRRTADDGRKECHDQRPTTNDQLAMDDRQLTAVDWRQTTDSQPPTPNSQLPAVRVGLRLRALGLVALAALPWAGNEGSIVSLLRLLGAAALIAALLWGFDRLARGQLARRWAWAYLGLDALLLLALLAAGYLALQSRLA